MNGIFVVLEERDGQITRLSWEAVAAAKRLSALVNQPVSAVLLGCETRTAISTNSTLTKGSFVLVFHVEHSLILPYTADGHTIALKQLIEAEKPAFVVFPHSYQVRDYAPALAARFDEVLIGDIVALEAGPVFTRQLMQGRLHGSYRHEGSGPCFLSVQAGAFPADISPATDALTAADPAPIQTFTPEIDPAQIRTRPSALFRGSAQTVDLASAQRIVSVGRGIQDEANIPLVQELAIALDAELAASRPICDNGWLPPDRQVGSSGQTVSPKLYLAVGISGAIQHQVGMKGAQCVVAINKDPDAPIFEIADYGIVGDLFEVVPALTEAVRVAK
jgi:electron transfer flavoprotein alpha subunit